MNTNKIVPLESDSMLCLAEITIQEVPYPVIAINVDDQNLIIPFSISILDATLEELRPYDPDEYPESIFPFAISGIDNSISFEIKKMKDKIRISAVSKKLVGDVPNLSSVTDLDITEGVVVFKNFKKLLKNHGFFIFLLTYRSAIIPTFHIISKNITIFEE